jgi:hypothetical protein
MKNNKIKKIYNYLRLPEDLVIEIYNFLNYSKKIIR